MARGPGHDKKLPRPGLLPTMRPALAVWVGSTIFATSAGAAQEAFPWYMRSYVVIGAWCFLGLATAFAVFWAIRKTWIERRVVELRFRACTECGYSLHDASQQGKCPECGAAYELDATIRAWQTWLDR